MNFPLTNDRKGLLETGLLERGFVKDNNSFKWNGYGCSGSKPYITFITNYHPRGFDRYVKAQFVVQITTELLLRVGVDDERDPFFVGLVSSLEEVDEIKKALSDPE